MTELTPVDGDYNLARAKKAVRMAQGRARMIEHAPRLGAAIETLRTELETLEATLAETSPDGFAEVQRFIARDIEGMSDELNERNTNLQENPPV